MLDPHRSTFARARDLTGRQIECLRWAAPGKVPADIGVILGLSARTVDDHLNVACRRLNVRTRIQAVVAAMSMGLLSTAVV